MEAYLHLIVICADNENFKYKIWNTNKIYFSWLCRPTIIAVLVYETKYDKWKIQRDYANIKTNTLKILVWIILFKRTFNSDFYIGYHIICSIAIDGCTASTFILEVLNKIFFIHPLCILKTLLRTHWFYD